MIDVASPHAFVLKLADWRRGLPGRASPVRLREERPSDGAAREALLDAAFGPDRFAKTCERLREGRRPADGLSLVALAGPRLVGTLRFWHIEAGDREALMLGPLAVCSTVRSAGIGRALIEQGLAKARKRGHAAVVLVGDAPYYERFGFRRALAEGLQLPGPVDDARVLGLELAPGALEGARGRVVGTGVFADAHLEGEYRLAA